MDSEAEVSEYSPVSPLTIVPPAGSQRSEENKTSSRLSPTIVLPPVVNEAEENETSSRLPATIVLLAGSQRSGREQNKLSPTRHYRSTRW